MHVSNVLLLAAVASAQAPPPPVLLTHTMSAVLPVLPTATPGPFAGIETIEGALVNDGPANPGFTGLLGNASVQMNTPGTTFTATLPAIEFDPLTGTTISGTVTGTVPANGTGVMFMINLSGFPSESAYGPFVYHIHALPVPADGNCTSTLAHLDPTDRGEYYPCDVTQPETCQAGDLSGKHGNITSASWTVNYLEPYLSTDPSSPYYFGDKSLVIHSMNTTRLTCANFVQNTTSSTAPSSSSAAAGVVGATGSPSVTPYTGSSTATAPAVATYTGTGSRTVAGSIVGLAALFIGAVML